MAINVDLPRTLAAVAGAAPQRRLDGLDLREVAGGSGRAVGRPLLNETGVPGLSNRNFHQAIRTATHKYVEHANGERELYDLLVQDLTYAEIAIALDRRINAVRTRYWRLLDKLRFCLGLLTKGGGHEAR